MKLTQAKFIEQSNIDASLIRAVVRQLGGWQSFCDSAPDICSYGIDGGFDGFIYHIDTVAFTKRNKDSIMTLARDMANSMGESGAIALIASFCCMRDYSQEDIARGLYDGRSDERTQVYNALAWFAGEEVSLSYNDILEESK